MILWVGHSSNPEDVCTGKPSALTRRIITSFKGALVTAAKDCAKLKISAASVLLDTSMLSQRTRVRLNVIISHIFRNLAIILNLMAEKLKRSSSITFKLLTLS